MAFLLRRPAPVPLLTLLHIREIFNNALPSGVLLLLKRFTVSAPVVSDIDPRQMNVGKICFPVRHYNNKKVRSLFQQLTVTVPHVKSLKKVWTLSYKCILTNRVREISFKLL